MAIRFDCRECGRAIRVRDDQAGRRVRCPDCDASVTAPDDEAEPGRGSVRAGRPPARRDEDEDDRPRRRRDEYDDDEADRPRSKSKGGGSPLPLILGIGGGVVGLALIGVLVWWLASGGRGIGPGGGWGGVGVPVNNFKEIGLLAHNHEAAYRGLPTNICDPRTGKPLLSWRVALLQHVEGGLPLYKQFKLDEPWDSPRNKPLIQQIPSIYLRPGQGRDGKTYCLSFMRSGKHTLAGPIPSATGVGMGIPAVTDGSSNTMFVADANFSVDWTKPEDIELGLNGSPKPFMRFEGGECLVGLLDGSIKRVNAGVGDETLKAAVTPNGMEILGADW